MPILNNIPRKKGRIITGSVFHREALNARLQHIPTGFEGLSYNSPFTESDKPPLGTNHNTATQAQLAPVRSQIPGVVVSAKQFQRVLPSQTSVSYNVGKPRPIVRRAGGGPSPHADTPFHPKKHVNLPPPRVPVHVSSELIQSHSSFFDTTSGKTLTAHAPNDPINQERWKVIKTGAQNV